MAWLRTADGVVGEFDAVIFDHDGTIVDSATAMYRAYGRWAEEFGVDARELPRYIGMPSESISALLVPGRSQYAADRIEQLEVEDTDGVQAMPGAAEAFAALPEGRTAIATSCTAPLLEARMRVAELPLPPVVVTRGDVVNGKPAPDSFLLAAERLGTTPERTLVVEDAPAGVAAARAGGFPVLGVLSSQTPEGLRADHHVKDLSRVRWEVGDEVLRARLVED
ncbi:MAG: HAD-IA family hydrolase [Arachnia propionica]|uniref:HAD family hydrolase n=1 Tax=Arachnia propionica TaxID=1750 RepID=UPI0027048D2E|nr:HAD-IA family hydrolase [Arachnia propionica]